MKAILIGGPYDRRFMEVEDHLTKTGLMLPANATLHEYRCEFLGIRATTRSGERSPCIFVHSSLTTLQAVEQVLDAYVEQA